MANPVGQPHESGAAPRAGAPIDLGRLHARLADVAAVAPPSARAAAMTGLLRDLTNAVACVYFVRRGAAIDATPLAAAPETLGGLVEPATLAGLAEMACASRRLETLSLAQPRPATALATPLAGGRGALVLVLVLGKAERETFATILQLAAAVLDAAALRDATPGANAEALLRGVAASPDLDSACFAVADAVAAATGAAHVAVVLREPRTGAATLRALSGVPEVDRRASLATDVAAAGAQALRADAPVAWHADAGEAARALATAARPLHAAAAWAVPMRSAAGGPVGALVCFAPALPDAPEALQPAADVAGTALDAHRRAHRGPAAAWRRLGPQRRKVIGAAILVLVAAMFVPVPHTLVAPTVIEPESRRYVSAPFEAILGETRVRPGDRVREGDVLAVLDGRVIELELAQLAAEREKAARTRDVALAQGDSAQIQIAGLEVARIDARAKLLASRRDQLEIRSPVEGVVVQGELAREQGSPVQVGQRLFEIAPLGRMIAELYLPATDIPHFRDGMTATVTIAGLGGREWTQPVERLHPRAVLHENRSAFVAELALDNPDALLKPGMRGEAHLAAGRRALGWVLFHRAWERVLTWLS
jgi:biotin carboxyl carrier protein